MTRKGKEQNHEIHRHRRIGNRARVGGAAAQTVAEQAQVLREFQQSVADYTQAHRSFLFLPDHVSMATPAPIIFTLPVSMVFRQLIAKALDARGHATTMRGIGHGLPLDHHPVVFELFPTMELHEFPPVLLSALPPLPRQLEYRLIGHDLVLRDAEADLIVGVLRDAVGGVPTVKR